MNFPAHALPAHTDVNEIDPETGIPVFLRRGSAKPAATPLDRFLNLLGITPNKGECVGDRRGTAHSKGPAVSRSCWVRSC
jgi:hypothetical protein